MEIYYLNPVLRGIEYFALLRLALLANCLVLFDAVLVEVPATDAALGHIVRGRTRWYLSEDQKTQLYTPSPNKREPSHQRTLTGVVAFTAPPIGLVGDRTALITGDALVDNEESPLLSEVVVLMVLLARTGPLATALVLFAEEPDSGELTGFSRSAPPAVLLLISLEMLKPANLPFNPPR